MLLILFFEGNKPSLTLSASGIRTQSVVAGLQFEDVIFLDYGNKKNILDNLLETHFHKKY